MKAHDIGLGKYLVLPLRAWNDIAELKQQYTHWSEATIIANALHHFADVQEKLRLEAEQSIVKEVGPAE